MRKNTLVLIFFALTLLFVATFSSAFLVTRPQQVPNIPGVLAKINSIFAQDTGTKVFVVNEGESAADIGNRLAGEGLVRWPVLFRLAVDYMDAGEDLRAGVYSLRGDMNLFDVVSELRSGKGTRSITVPEGWRTAELGADLESKGIINRKAFIIQISSTRPPFSIRASAPPGSSLEGYLFPDTYQLSANFTASTLVELMVGNLDKRFTREMRNRAQDMGLTIHEVITLASIVEREATLSDDRDVIAGVFLNRLRMGMPLAADPTVQYALAAFSSNVDADGYWKKDLTEADLNVPSPYNTYIHPGLPPGPICNPGLASINAVLYPRDTDYLYFVAAEDGSHIFSSTYEEHLENISRVQGQAALP